MSVREKTQADFDLEKMFAYLDEALTSKDERVQSALRGLLTIIELTRPQDDGHMAVETSHGPLRQMQEDLKHMNRRLNNLAEEMRQMRPQPAVPANPYMPGPYNIGAGNPYPMGPYNPGSTNPYSPNWGPNPTAPYTTSVTNPATVSINPGPFMGSMDLTGNEKDSTMNIKLSK
jgi:predicted transcriptional regulator